MCIMGKGRLGQWLHFLVCVLLVLKTEGFDVGITYIQSAVAKGAVCLDGSPPAYHFDKGSGAGINNWLVFFEGGAWCNNATTCLERTKTHLGSSKLMDKEISFSGIFSNEQKFNPDFYNWNRIKVRYCDGSSFTGDVEAVNPANKLYFRGGRIFVAVIEDLMAKGMQNAENAILSGCSAGGLASILLCDKFRALLPARTKVKCVADAGFFINAKDVSGAQHIEGFYNDVVTTHGSAKNLPSYCTSRMKPGLCFFPQNMAGGIQTPLFLINAAYDSWQVKNILAPGVADPHGTWPPPPSPLLEEGSAAATAFAAAGGRKRRRRRRRHWRIWWPLLLLPRCRRRCSSPPLLLVAVAAAARRWRFLQISEAHIEPLEAFLQISESQGSTKI